MTITSFECESSLNIVHALIPAVMTYSYIQPKAGVNIIELCIASMCHVFQVSTLWKENGTWKSRSSFLLWLIFFDNDEVKYQCAFKRTSKIMKYGQDVIIQNGQMYDIQNGKWYQVLQIEKTYHASCMTSASVKLMLK